jgi:hypothetical protein
MPMLDVYIPEGALEPAAEQQLIAQLTDLLLKHEGADPTNERARSLAWVFLHRPQMFVAGEPESEPHYRIVASVPEGQYDDERRAAMTAAATEAVLDAEQGARPRDPMRVWVFTQEIPEGTCGGDGRIQRLGDIAAFVTGNEEAGQRYAELRLAERRKALASA